MAIINSKVDIANLSLTQLGQKRISSFDDNNDVARSISYIYDQIEKESLVMYNWSFATEVIDINRLEGETNNKWEYKFLIPNTVVRIIKILDDTNTELPTINYARFGKEVHCNSKQINAMVINKKDITTYPSYFIKVIYTKLSHYLAGIYKSKDNHTITLQSYELAVQEAKKIENSESGASVIEFDNPFIQVRNI